MYNLQLDTFVAVVECGSFSKAAERLYLTPAAVMNQINALEAHLGLKLFTRSSRGVELTAAGASLCTDARRIMAESARAIDRAHAVQAEAAATIRIGSSLLNPCQEFLDRWHECAQDPDAYSFQIVPYSDDRRQILQVVQGLGETMDALVGPLGSARILETCEFVQLGAHRLCVAAPRGHALARRGRLAVANLAGQRIVAPVQESEGAFSAFERAHPEIEFLERDVYYDLETFNWCEQHRCLLLTLESWAQVHPSLVTLPVDWELSTPYGLLISRDAVPEVRAFAAEASRAFGG